jgi:uroporphyrinogen III methyltransferase/synthase
MISSVRNQGRFICITQMDETELSSHLSKNSGGSGGIVYLVGAGPGDPGLITVRGAELLASAEIVIYDALANPQLLRHCPGAHTIYVGKQADRHSKTQEEINGLLVEHGRSGKLVVRLKGGDPFVFGRGGEECEALAAAGVRFEVVPGITAAIAATAYAGIPVTHRDFNSSFTFIAGHEKEESVSPGAASDIDWGAMAKLPCLAFYMGVKSLPRICEKLIGGGMASDMPAAIIQWGTTPRQKTVVGTIGDLAQRAAEAKIGSPALTIVGKVVGLRSTMNWFERRPLFGKTIVVTRSREQASELSQQLNELGANVIEEPTIELAPAADQGAVNAALRAMNEFDWIVFTSPTGVKHARRRLLDLGLDARAFGLAKIAAVGEETARAIGEQLNLRVDLCPTQFVAEALADELQKQGEISGKRFLLLRADIARPVLTERLRDGGAKAIEDVAIYQTRPAAALSDSVRAALDAGEVHWITFTSSSTVKNFLAQLGPGATGKLSNVRLASIGPITSQTIVDAGLKAIEAQKHSVDGLVKAIVAAEAG